MAMGGLGAFVTIFHTLSSTAPLKVKEKKKEKRKVDMGHGWTGGSMAAITFSLGSSVGQEDINTHLRVAHNTNS